MKKRTVALLVCALFTVGVFAGASAAGKFREITAQLRPDFTIKVDGQVQEFKSAKGEVVYPILHEGTTYLPVRAIGELMDKVVYWYEDEKRVELRKPTVTDADVIVFGEEKEANAKNEKASFIGEEKAKALALEKAGFKADEVRFDKIELDEDDGIWHYEIEFVTGCVEYEIDIGAVNGAILKWEKDVEDLNKKPEIKIEEEKPLPEEPAISSEQAKKLALEKAGLSAADAVFEKLELDHDDGKLVYEIELRKDGIEYEGEIDATNGTVISWSVDQND